MYIHDRELGYRDRRAENPVLLRPSQVYQYRDPAQAEENSVAIGSFLGFLAGPPTVADKIRDSWRLKKDEQEIFKILREQSTYPLDTSVTTELHAIFPTGKDERTLADTIALNGPEPLWPLSEIKKRLTLKLKSDPGNYKATLQDPSPGGVPSGVPGTCINTLKPSELPEAFFFQGRSDRCALVIAGVHGDEKRGVEVVKLLQTNLTGARLKPFFTTILVPVVIPRTNAKGSRNVPGGLGFDKAGRKACRPVEPNRNFPLPGEDFAAAQKRGKSGLGDPELVIRAAGSERAPKDTDPTRPFTSIRMLPETRILISLIERFQPERLATIHDHSLKQACHPCLSGAVTKCGGEGPGIFVDPRGIHPSSLTITDTTQLRADDDLARRMVEMALKRMPCGTAFSAFAGNLARYPPTVRYFSQQRVEGNSLGDWAPVKAGIRPGITTLTIEVPKYDAVDAAMEKLVKELHRNVLRMSFLEP
jgi:hypothetical protein